MVFKGLNGKVALITGANSGIGLVTARTMALEGYRVFLACRDRAKTEAVIAEIARLSDGKAVAEFLPLDLGDFASVRQCAALFLASQQPLHVLIANAGLAGSPGLTASGFEKTFGVCHMGHFLLTDLLLPCLKASAPARVVVVASLAHQQAKTIDFAAQRQPSKSPLALKEYAVAKLANILFAKELARRLAGSGVTTYALHPGVVATNVWRVVPKVFAGIAKRLMLTEEQGAATTLYCAMSPEVAEQTGLYYFQSKVTRCTRVANDPALAAQLWQHSVAWLA